MKIVGKQKSTKTIAQIMQIRMEMHLVYAIAADVYGVGRGKLKALAPVTTSRRAYKRGVMFHETRNLCSCEQCIRYARLSRNQNVIRVYMWLDVRAGRRTD
jgi:hypothetical protein